MKRFIPLFLVIAILVCCMVVPVFAESSLSTGFNKIVFTYPDSYKVDSSRVYDNMIYNEFLAYQIFCQDLSNCGSVVPSTSVTIPQNHTFEDDPLFNTAPVGGEYRRRILVSTGKMPFSYDVSMCNELRIAGQVVVPNISGTTVRCTVRFETKNGTVFDYSYYPTGMGGFYYYDFTTGELDPGLDQYRLTMLSEVFSVRLLVDIQNSSLMGSGLTLSSFSCGIDMDWNAAMIISDIAADKINDLKDEQAYTVALVVNTLSRLEGVGSSIDDVQDSVNGVAGGISGVQNILDGMEGSLGDIQSGINGVNQNIGHLDDLFGNLQDDNDMIIDQIGGVTDGYESMKEQIDSGLGGLSGQVGNVQSGIDDIQGGINGVQNGIGGIQSGIDDVNQNIGHLDDLFGNLQDDNDMIIDQIGGVTDGYESMKEQIDSGLGGLDDRFSGERYDSIDAGVDDLSNLEESLFSSINGSLSNAEHYFTGGLDALAPYGNAMLAYTSMFNHLITEPLVDAQGKPVTDHGVPVRKNNVFGDLLTVSLALGALVAILNIAVHASSVTQAHERLKVAEAKRDMRFAMGKQRR